MKHLASRISVDWVKTILIGLLLTGIYYSSYGVMIKWWRRDDYNYCYLIPFVVGYLIWEKRHIFSSQPSMPAWQGLVLFAPGILLFWLGELGGEYYTIYFSSWLVLVGLIWMHEGWSKLKIILFPMCLLITIFPAPNAVNLPLSLKLKLISSQIAIAVIQAMGITAYREGNVIDLGFTQLQVVDACSGLRYLIPLLVLSLLLAHFFKADWWKRIFLVLSSIPISILVNGLRIVSVALLYPIWGPQVAEGLFHDFSGWLIFMASIGILLFEIWLLGKIGKAPVKSTAAPPFQTSGLKLRTSSKSSGFIQPQFIAAVLLLASTLLLSHGIEFREKVPIAKSLDNFPMQVAEWIGQREGMEQKLINKLDFNDYIIVNYQNPSGKSVNFYVAYYESQLKGESIHSPETCLPGGGWVFKRSGMATLPLENHNPVEMTVNRVFMQKDGWRQLSYFWFPQRGRILTGLFQLKLFNFLDALTRHRTDGALVRLITPVGDTEPVDEADRRLQAFAQVIVPVLDDFLPR